MKERIVLFDGVCNLCNSSVQRIIRNDPRKKFKFSSLQSDSVTELLAPFATKIRKTDSIILIVNRKKIFIKSSAALRIAVQMKFPYPLLGIFFIVPFFLRDIFYDWIARNRYKWYGKQDSCMIPTPEIKERFPEKF